jgi:DNA-binding transcriptional LysR family regulator
MEIRYLRAFVEVVREGGFSRAARRLHLTQSAVSKAVKQLEEELQLPLLDRVGHQSRLTEAGKLVFQKAEAILAQGDDLQSELRELRGLGSGTLRLGLPAIGSSTLFGRWFAVYRSRFPGIHIQLGEYGSKTLEKMVLAGELDLAGSLLPVSTEFAWQPVRREPIDVILSAQHPLANRRQIAFKSLAAEPFILYAPGFALNPIIRGACQQCGFEPKVVAESSQVEFVIELAAAKMGVAFVPRMVAEQRAHPLVKCLPLAQPKIHWHMALIWRRGGYLPAAAKAWLALAGELFPSGRDSAAGKKGS